MAKFKHHSMFTAEKQKRSYLLPHVCFVCRKSFRRPYSEEGRKCPDCGGLTTRLSRKFKAPKVTDTASWHVVEYVVRAGFLYQSIHLENGGTATYPSTMGEAEQFVRAYGKH